MDKDSHWIDTLGNYGYELAIPLKMLDYQSTMRLKSLIILK